MYVSETVHTNHSKPKPTTQVKDGVIPESRIDESYQRIMKLKRSYGVIDARR